MNRLAGLGRISIVFADIDLRVCCSKGLRRTNELSRGHASSIQWFDGNTYFFADIFVCGFKCLRRINEFLSDMLRFNGFFIIPGLSRHLGLISVFLHSALLVALSAFSAASVISLLHAYFHLRVGRPLFIFPGMSNSSILPTLCSFSFSSHGRTTSVVFL